MSLVVAGSSGSSGYTGKMWRLGREECGGVGGKKKPKAAKKIKIKTTKKPSWMLNIKGTKEGHRDRKRKPRTGSASSVSQ